MSDQAAVHVTRWGGADARALRAARSSRAVLVHGTMTWGEECFAEQRALADEFVLEVMDRRGFGDSPDIACSEWESDWEVDAADVVDLLGSAGAHLVGHSYGGVVALAAATRRPGAVRSLALIEPSALRIAEQVPVVGAALERNRAMFADGSPFRGMTAEDYLRSGEELGYPVPAFTERRLRATRTAMAERPCWEAQIDLEPLALMSVPKVVITGTWVNAPTGYRESTGDALMACSAFIAERIGARLVRVPDAGHMAHQERPDVVNGLLRDVWRSCR